MRQYCFKVSLFSKFTKKGSPWNSIVAIKFMLEEEGWCTPSLHSLYHLMLLNMKCSPMSLFASDSEYIVFTISLFNTNLFLSRVSLHFYSSLISSCLENCVPANPFKGFILMYCWLFCMNLLWTLGGSLSVYSPFTTIFCSIWLSGIAEKMIRKNEQPEKPKQLFAFRSFCTCLSICHALHHFSICF